MAAQLDASCRPVWLDAALGGAAIDRFDGSKMTAGSEGGAGERGPSRASRTLRGYFAAGGAAAFGGEGGVDGAGGASAFQVSRM
jgi:hypothetical protein